MADKNPETNRNVSPDWFVRGALTRIGDTFDRFLGRKWTPSSSLATSELIERIKRLLDSEARDVPGKGLVVPHEIKLKVQWNKFSTEGEELTTKLENELLVATADHINDLLYYTYAPLSISVEPDYFIEGVKLAASFGPYAGQPEGSELNITIAGVKLPETDAPARPAEARRFRFDVRFALRGSETAKEIELVPGRSISVGRVGSNALVIDDGNVSKVHASLSVDGDGVLHLADTGSTNGTFLNAKRIAYGKAIALAAGDKVAFGTIEAVFTPVDPPAKEVGDPSQAETVEIEGFQFVSRQASDEPAAERPPQEEDEASG